MARTVAGYPVDFDKPPTNEDLKSPILWLSQAHALSQAASVVLKSNPNLIVMPQPVRSVCDSQYCAVGLMLVGYSLEICLKAMLIMKHGIERYSQNEKKHKHHRLVQLAEFIPDLSEKDKAILKNLTSFVTWAGRYPDPGSGRKDNPDEIFNLSEKYEIAARDLFSLSARIMNHANQIVENEDIT